MWQDSTQTFCTRSTSNRLRPAGGFTVRAPTSENVASIRPTSLFPDPVGFDLGATGQLEVSIQISPQIGVGVSHYPYADSYTDWGYGSIETSFLLHSTPEASTFTLFVTMVSIAAGSIRPASRADRSRRLTQSDPAVRWFDAGAELLKNASPKTAEMMLPPRGADSIAAPAAV